MRRHLLRSFRTFSITVLIIVAGALSQAAPATRDWQPHKTWVFVVGVLKCQHRDMFDSFPQKNRRDAQLVEYFRQQGVPEEQIIFLQDEQATSRRVHNAFPTLLAKARPDDLLFFYYTGHGYKSDDARTTYFATYDAGDNVDGWATDSIVRDIEQNFRGSRALLVADTCYSGSLATQTQRIGRRVSFASLTSSSSSQESTENWTFTEMLLAGFQGRSFADINGDGQVTLSELAEDIKQDMAFAEGQRSVFVTTGNFPPAMLIGPAQNKINPQISRRVEVRSDGNWYKARIVDVRGGRYHVHYYGWEDSDDEWVTAAQIRNLKTVEYAVGASVEVSWQGQWYAAKVLKNERGVHLIHYIGYDEGWDEWVSDKRIRALRNWN